MNWDCTPIFAASRAVAAREDSGIPTVDHILQNYLRATNLDSLKDWIVYICFVFYRGAAILQGVYKRFLQGISSR